jgi:hypothetical protein
VGKARETRRGDKAGGCCKVRLSKAKDSPRPDRAKAKADTNRADLIGRAKEKKAST